jgi:hypothetical protein
MTNMAYVLPTQSNTTADAKHILRIAAQAKINVAYVLDHMAS